MRRRGSKIFMWIFVLIPIAIVGYWAVTYFTYYDKPKSVRESIELLERSDIINKIGSYECYSYYDENLPDETDNPARFKLSMKGSNAIIYLSCEAKKTGSGKWILTKIEQDSLIKENY
jgi:hypothetical protein